MATFFMWFGGIVFTALMVFGLLVLICTISEIWNRRVWNKRNKEEEFWRKKIAKDINSLVNSRFVDYASNKEDGYVPNKIGLLLGLVASGIETEKLDGNGEIGLLVEVLGKIIKGDESYSTESARIEITSWLFNAYHGEKDLEELESYVKRVFDEDKDERV